MMWLLCDVIVAVGGVALGAAVTAGWNRHLPNRIRCPYCHRPWRPRV